MINDIETSKVSFVTSDYLGIAYKSSTFVIIILNLIRGQRLSMTTQINFQRDHLGDVDDNVASKKFRKKNNETRGDSVAFGT